MLLSGKQGHSVSKNNEPLILIHMNNNIAIEAATFLQKWKIKQLKNESIFYSYMTTMSTIMYSMGAFACVCFRQRKTDRDMDIYAVV